MECKFNVGETYKTRDGQDAIVEAIRPEAEGLYKIVAFVGGSLELYMLDGTFLKGSKHLLDLILPPRVVWVVFGHAQLACWADTEEEAKKFGGTPVRVELPA